MAGPSVDRSIQSNNQTIQTFRTHPKEPAGGRLLPPEPSWQTHRGRVAPATPALVLGRASRRGKTLPASGQSSTVPLRSPGFKSGWLGLGLSATALNQHIHACNPASCLTSCPCRLAPPLLGGLCTALLLGCRQHDSNRPIASVPIIW